MATFLQTSILLILHLHRIMPVVWKIRHIAYMMMKSYSLMVSDQFIAVFANLERSSPFPFTQVASMYASCLHSMPIWHNLFFSFLICSVLWEPISTLCKHFDKLQFSSYHFVFDSDSGFVSSWKYFFILLYHILSDYLMPILSRSLVKSTRHVMSSYDSIPYQITPHHDTPYQITSFHVTSYRTIWRHITPYRTTPYHIKPHFTIPPQLILSHTWLCLCFTEMLLHLI